MVQAVQVFWSPAGANMPSLGARALVDVTDGDTPNLRMAGTDAVGGHSGGDRPDRGAG
jgi:hypothetical protein